MQFMGRYSIWEKLFPHTFDEKARQYEFKNNPWMLELYEFLITHQDIESANKDFGKMVDILKTNFSGF